MAFAFERDDLRQELRKDNAGTIRIWAKADGVGNVAASGTHTFTVYGPGGETVQASGAVSPTNVSGVSRFDCSVSAITTLGEDYRVELSWQYSSATYLSVMFFDVVLWPFGELAVSLNDLQEERPEIGEVLAEMATRLSLSGAAEMAAIFAYRARVELDAKIRDQIRLDALAAGQSFTSAGNASLSNYTRPNLILNRERLNRVERKIALELIFAADANNHEDGEDESSALYRHYRAAADAAWKSLGPLKYDSSEDLTPDETVRDATRVFRTRRCQA